MARDLERRRICTAAWLQEQACTVSRERTAAEEGSRRPGLVGCHNDAAPIVLHGEPRSDDAAADVVGRELSWESTFRYGDR